uniref:Uncharacterized protein n=1 Tax=Aegilops tauschii subsp. strangulata TaxID=200361 RepID=A0A453D7S8_AEGTS
ERRAGARQGARGGSGRRDQGRRELAPGSGAAGARDSEALSL